MKLSRKLLIPCIITAIAGCGGFDSSANIKATPAGAKAPTVGSDTGGAKEKPRDQPTPVVK